MDIMLEIVSRQKHSATFPISHVFGEAGGYIGRSEESEWVLPDRTKKISRKHALISFDEGSFFLEDLSSNGVHLSLEHEAIGKGKRHRIEHGEGFTIGDYLIMARLLHDPGAYVSSAREAQEDLLTLVQHPLSLDPLKSMDQEEELIARRRMGDFDDLLGRRTVAHPPPSDHSDPITSTLQPVVAIPEDWDSDPDDLDEKEQNVSRLQPAATADPPARHAPARPQEPEKVTTQETDMFFKALGFTEASASPAERERVLRLAAELLLAAVGGMTQALQHRAECKNELRLPITTTSLAARNNPLKFSPTPEAALVTLLQPQQKGVLPAPLAMHEGFNDLHSHHMGLVAGSRAVVQAALDKVSPRAVERRLDINGPIRLRRTARLWHTYMRLHQALLDDHDSFQGLFLQDFAQAYEMQSRTPNPSTIRISQGDRK